MRSSFPKLLQAARFTYIKKRIQKSDAAAAADGLNLSSAEGSPAVMSQNVW
jgi:hypothetical protein